ncbi:hypothetical protein M9458_002775, partial [Cirrhinus mrigala]
VVDLQALPPEEADPALALLCPVRAYTLLDRTQSISCSEQLLFAYWSADGECCPQAEVGHWVVIGPHLGFLVP